MYADGISTKEAYPYFKVNHNCTVKPDIYALKVHGRSVNITESDENELKSAFFGYGPVSIAFQVVAGFKDYKSGIYTSNVCKNTTQDVNHAVVVVGFGHCDVSNKDYSIVKNSWSTAWGDQHRIGFPETMPIRFSERQRVRFIYIEKAHRQQSFKVLCKS